MQQKTNKKQSQPEFVCKLCDMIEKFPLIINWNTQGDRIVILDITQMQIKVLPQYFRHSNFPSFIRQLNMYDFHKVYKKANQISFKNQIFQRGNQSNYHFIQRKKRIKQQQLMSQEFMKKNQSILSRLHKEMEISQPIKQLIKDFLQYKYVVIDNIKKIKLNLQRICQELKQCRTKKINQTLHVIKTKLLQEMNLQIKVSKQIDKYLDQTFLKQQNHTNENIQGYLSNAGSYSFFIPAPMYSENKRNSFKDFLGLHHNFSLIDYTSVLSQYNSLNSSGYPLKQKVQKQQYDNFDDENSLSSIDEQQMNKIIGSNNNNKMSQFNQEEIIKK